MRKLICIIGLFILLVVGYIIGKQNFYVNADFVKPKSGDEKILIVQAFWEDALNQGDIEKYITPTPKEFYDETPRCSTNELGNDDKNIEMSHAPSQDRNMAELRKLARAIEAGQLKIKNAKIHRYWEKEAIVDVDFIKPERQKNNLEILEKRFFYLILTDGKWKIFMDSGVVTIFNKEFANSECSK